MNCSSSTSSGPTGPGPTATSLEGTWKGHTLGDTNTFTAVFTGNNFSFSLGLIIGYAGTFSINAASNPKTMDVVITQCANTAYVGKTSLGIYKVSSDTLTYAANEPGNPNRPTSFAYDSTGTTVVFVFVKQ
ncbi:MAG TPA: TIGR03067 domain-containing protein [Chitinivibrionales bacterium]|nr:TIGR03067 domain-containing protein [Chitinivibrionales bacterium]